MSEVTQVAKVDGWVQHDAPDVNNVEAAYLRLTATAAAEKVANIYFSIPFELGATISSATLNLFLRSWPASTTIRANRITSPWQEDAVTYNTLPSTFSTNFDLAGVTGSDGTMVSIPITSMMSAVAAGSDFYGIRVSVLGTGNTWVLHSAQTEDADLAPYLDITYSTPPLAPSDLRPSGGASVAPAQPTYAWQPDADNADGSEQAKSRVQVWNAARTAIIYDSGLVANAESSWNTAGTSHPSLADGDQRWWRVTTQDESGLNSPWSPLSGFYRQSQGTLAFTNPSGSTVNSLVYPFTWTLTGRTQEAYEMLLYKVADTSVDADNVDQLVWHLPKVTAATATQVVDPDIIKSGETYRMVLRTWDTMGRQTVENAAAWQEVTKTFTFTPDTLAGGPSTLVATQPTDPDYEGAVTLTWTIPGAAPQYFSLSVDGVEVDTQIDPVDTLVSGSTYSMNYWGAVPNTSHTYEMKSVLASGGTLKPTTGNPTVIAAALAQGKWLVHHQPGKDLAVRILDRDTPSLTIGESGTTYYPVHSRRPVRITDAIRGFEGTVTGHVPNKDAADTLWKLKGRLLRMRFLDKSLNIPVRLGEVSVAPDSSYSPQDYYSVSIEMWQVDEFPKTPGIHIPGGNETVGGLG